MSWQFGPKIQNIKTHNAFIPKEKIITKVY
jgi:hypothetical protein